MRKTIYIYLDCLSGHYDTTSFNFWTSEQEKATGLQVGEYSTKQLVSIQEIEFEEFSPGKAIECKIASLETKLQKDLADSYVRQHNLQDQINELKCITHNPDPSDDIPY